MDIVSTSGTKSNVPELDVVLRSRSLLPQPMPLFV